MQWHKVWVLPKPDFPATVHLSGTWRRHMPAAEYTGMIWAVPLPPGKLKSFFPWKDDCKVCTCVLHFVAAPVTAMAMRREGIWGQWHLNYLEEDSPGDACQNWRRVAAVLVDWWVGFTCPALLPLPGKPRCCGFHWPHVLLHCCQHPKGLGAAGPVMQAWLWSTLSPWNLGGTPCGWTNPEV